jgi:hypothetical protein
MNANDSIKIDELKSLILYGLKKTGFMTMFSISIKKVNWSL